MIPTYRCSTYRVVVFFYTLIFILFACSCDYPVAKMREIPKAESPAPTVAVEIVTAEPEPIPPIVEEEPSVQYFDVPLSHDLQDYIFLLCRERGIDPGIIIAMIYKESTYRPSLVGDHGRSFGLMQIQPRWHKGRMAELGCSDLLDPYQNVTVGIDLFGDLLEAGDSVEWALMAYNGGSSYANRKSSRGEVSTYVKTVLKVKESLTYDQL